MPLSEVANEAGDLAEMAADPAEMRPTIVSPADLSAGWHHLSVVAMEVVEAVIGIM